MHTSGLVRAETSTTTNFCAICGIPLDSQYFDESGVANTPLPGKEVVLASFELSPQYCGVLEYFSQFTDRQAKDYSQIETPGLEWTILLNNRPLYPYIRLNRIVNPWGYGNFKLAIRLDEDATVDFVVRGLANGSFSTAIRSNITGSPSEQAVSPDSMANIKVGTELLIDTGLNEEVISVLSLTATTFTAIFRNSHSAPVTVSGSSIRKVGGRIMGRYWYNPAYGDVERRRF